MRCAQRPGSLPQNKAFPAIIYGIHGIYLAGMILVLVDSRNPMVWEVSTKRLIGSFKLERKKGGIEE